MSPIEITGLNKRQQILADIIWGIDDWPQVEIFINSLSKRDRIDCEGIIEMMRMFLVEQYAEAMKRNIKISIDKTCTLYNLNLYLQSNRTKRD
jgi:hypothetical protein